MFSFVAYHNVNFSNITVIVSVVLEYLATKHVSMYDNAEECSPITVANALI